jgi:ABC-type transporter MlaC component
MRNLFLISLLFVSFSLLASEGPEQIVGSIFTKARQKEVATNLKLQASINELIDFQGLCQKAYGSEFSKLPAEKQEWFVKTVSEIITKTVYPKAPSFLNQVKITYGKSSVSVDEATVKSKVKSKGESTSVDYKLRKVNGSWKVIDVIFDDESWTEDIRDQVQETLKKEQWAGLEKRLGDRLETLRKNGNTK